MGKIPKLVRKLRPSVEEVDHYARLILQHEHQPISALPEAQREAELQLWAMRSLVGAGRESSDRRGPSRFAGA